MIENSKCANCGHSQTYHLNGVGDCTFNLSKEIFNDCKCKEYAAQPPKDCECGGKIVSVEGRRYLVCEKCGTRYMEKSQPPDPKLSIVEEFKYHHFCYGDDYDVWVIPQEKFAQLEASYLTALEAHGKAEREKMAKRGAEMVNEAVKLAHAAGFTEGVEKAIEAVSDINKRDLFGTPGIVPEEVMEFRKAALDALETLKPKQ